MMENKRNNNVLIIVLVTLLFIAVCVICYLLGSNNVKENNKPQEEINITPTSYIPKCNNNQQNLQVNIDDTQYNNIFDYIKGQQNVKINLLYCSNSEDAERVNYTLTEAEKIRALNEMKDNNHYVETDGLGGGACVPTVEIKYERNNKQYVLKYWGHIMDSNDGNIYKILDKSISATQIQDSCGYLIETLGSTINNIIKYEN